MKTLFALFMQHLTTTHWPGKAARTGGLMTMLLLAGCHPAPDSPSMRPGPGAPPSVAVARVTREDLARLLTLPAEFRPKTEVELHAKVTGYVDRMNVDFGDRVKAGQLLATLEVPELYDQLRNAAALWERAGADATNAEQIRLRLEAVNREHPNLVAPQEMDTARARAGAAQAAAQAARAEVEKFETMTNFTRITAPFAGVITRRSADPGALVAAGTAGTGPDGPLLRLSDNYQLRLDFEVTVDYVQYIHAGSVVTARVDSLGGRVVNGVITRFSSRVNPETRTMLVEMEVPNPDLLLVPGMYAAVTLPVEQHARTLAVPISAVSGGRNPVVYRVGGNGELEARPVRLGLETPERWEILEGLREGDQVVVGRPPVVPAGEKVTPVAAAGQ